MTYYQPLSLRQNGELNMEDLRIILCGSKASISADASAVSGCICTEAEPDRMSLVGAVIRKRPDAVIVHQDDIGRSELISALEFTDSLEPHPVYIVIGQDTSELYDRFSYVHRFVRTPDISCIKNCIRPDRTVINGVPQTVSSEERDMERAVTEIIVKIGIPAHIKGYRYLRSSVLMALRDMSVLDSITKRLYPSVARYHGTTSSCVERAIRHAISSAWEKGGGDVDFIESKLRCKIDYLGEKPTNSELIALISDSMRLTSCA